MSDDSPYDDFIYFLKSDDSEYMMRRQIEIWRGDMWRISTKKVVDMKR